MLKWKTLLSECYGEFTVIWSGGNIDYPLNTLIAEVFEVSCTFEWAYTEMFLSCKLSEGNT